MGIPSFRLSSLSLPSLLEQPSPLDPLLFEYDGSEWQGMVPLPIDFDFSVDPFVEEWGELDSLLTTTGFLTIGLIIDMSWLEFEKNVDNVPEDNNLFLVITGDSQSSPPLTRDETR